MPQAPEIFDRALLMARRRRMTPAGDFLHRVALADVRERLADVNRRFGDALLVWPGAPVWAEDLARSPDIDRLRVLDMTEEEVLPVAEASADLVVAGLSLHAANDPLGLLIQMRRALRPDGLLLAPLFGGETLRELRDSFLAAEAELDGGAAPRVAPMGEVRDLGALLQRAGFALPVADVTSAPVAYASVFGLLADLRAMGETNVLTTRDRRPLRRRTLMRMAQIYADRFPDGDRVRATFQIVMLTGWAPHDSQQRPLRPGSAKMRLEDALKQRG